jgi:chromosome condensin MukBEF ATPase and DNA-binding subunit MukB
MKNRLFLVTLLVIIVTVISTGCGVSKSQYDAVAVELNLVKQDRQALQAQLQEAQSELLQTKTELTRAQVKLETAQTDLETAQGQLQVAQADRQTAQAQLQESQSELAQTKADLQNALAQVQSLQNALDAAGTIPAEALSYAEFMDILMYEEWLAAGVTPNFTFSTAGEYLTALKNRAASIGDATLIGFVAEIEAGTFSRDRLDSMGYYCLDKIEAILK